MCNPAAAFAVISLVISTATTVVANNRQNDMIEAQAESADKAAKYDYQRLVEKGQQISEQGAQEKLQRQLQTARERGRLMVAQGQAGVTGNSTMAMLNNAITQGTMDTSIIDANRRGALDQTQAEADAVYAGLSGRQNVNKAGSMGTGTQLMTAGMSGAQGAMAGYQFGSSLSKNTPKKIS